MNPNAIIDFLRSNPQFLEEHADLLCPPSQAEKRDAGSGRVMSLAEHQMRSLRDKNTALERQMRELLRAGSDNDATSERLHRVTLAFFSARDLATTLDVLRQSLADDFQVPYVSLRLWAVADDAQGDARPLTECLPVSVEIEDYADALTAPYCGRQVSAEIKSWFHDTRDPGSFALIPLRARHTFGLLALASPDEQRFHAGMGAVYLIRLSELASMAMARYLRFA